ncbi:MAG: ATP-dependent DNA helicase RecG [Devosiaceae bacterium]|nr:ATP-dependent DNA helicase RecG [Devosiaceae bacterium]
MPEGEQRFVSGEVAEFAGKKQIVHPDYVVPLDKFDTMPLVEPVYPLTHGLSSKVLRRLIANVVKTIPPIDEWIQPERMNANNWPSFAKAMENMHAPTSPQDTDILGPARLRLAYDEYFAGQLTLQLIRSQMVVERGIPRKFTNILTRKLDAVLPFQLTKSQQNAILEIKQDMETPNRMSRLLQGDVGSGKTIVALAAMVAMAESGAQSALMAPTELLANQHFDTLLPLCKAVGLSITLITGKMKAAEKQQALEKIKTGEIQIIVGTHALFQASVTFADLGLTIVDEQHRFGVHQRLALSNKGQKSDLLVMTATPIPRTLILTHFGDMAISVLSEKPAGRQPIDTAMVPASTYGRVISRLKKRVEEGAQAYWVCPLVEESEIINLVSATDRHAALKKEFGDKVSLIHGRMKPGEKQNIMRDFKDGKISILVATTVIEVGVDVPNATIMIVEHAERFGLSQLHQLRGRVGRGEKNSACLLIYQEPLGETAAARLNTLTQTEDGFEIAEQDLILRGSGDLLGTRQSGMPGYRLAIPDVHKHLLEWAHQDASQIMAENPTLAGVEGDALKNLLYVFRRDLAIPLFRAG